jgi:imidazolonepropionase-like amidohydrolase
MKNFIGFVVFSLLITNNYAQGLQPNVSRFVDVPSGPIALFNAALIDGTGSGVLHNMTIIIDDKRIKEIVSSEDAVIPDGAEIIDCTDKTVIPGLIMLHEHLCYPIPFEGEFQITQMSYTFTRLYLAGGVTTMRTAASLGIETDLNLRRWISEGKITGPKIDVTSPIIDRPGMQIPQFAIISSSEQAGRMVEFWADMGVSSIKVYRNVTREDLKEVLKKAHERNLKVTGHVGAVTHREAADLGIDNLEHGFWVSTDFVNDKAPDICPAWEKRSSSLLALENDDPEMEDLIRHLVDKGVALTSTLNVFEPYTGREVVPGGGIEALAPQLRERVLESYSRNVNNDSAKLMQFKKEMYWEKKFYDEGGLLLAGTDPTNTKVVAGYANQHTLELFVEAGFTVAEAVNICTLNGARYLDIDKETGSLENGKLADLVIINGDLDNDISNIRNMELVFKEGIGFNSTRMFESVKGQVGLN